MNIGIDLGQEVNFQMNNNEFPSTKELSDIITNQFEVRHRDELDKIIAILAIGLKDMAGRGKREIEKVFLDEDYPHVDLRRHPDMQYIIKYIRGVDPAYSVEISGYGDFRETLGVKIIVKW